MSGSSGRKEDFKDKIEDIFGEYIRVLKLARKPDKEEFMQVAKITAIGVLLVGAIGFVTYIGMGDLPETLAARDKGEIQAEFIENIDINEAEQTLELTIKNIDENSPTGKLNIVVDTIECNLISDEKIEHEGLDGGESTSVEIEVEDVDEASNVFVRIWGENLYRYESEGSALEINARNGEYGGMPSAMMQ